jgi:predicted dehydrogenase
MSRNQSRRAFLKSSTFATAAVLGVPTILPSSVFGANAPSKRVTMGIIGCGNQSSIDIPEFLSNEDCQILAVCDVNKASYGYKTPTQFLGREPQREFVEKHYAEKSPSGSYKGCKAYSDFRDVLARKDIDAIAIIAPDHWHAIMTILAAKAGKDIYCQKPLTLTVAEGKLMTDAVRKHGRILSTGSQWRSNEVMRKACELVRNGRVGKLKRVETYVAANNFQGPGPGWKEMTVPEGFDYDMWLGPAPKVPYHQDRCLYKFRFVSDYSGGQTTNFGAHSIDIAHWGMGVDDTGPVEVEDLGAEFPAKGDLFDTATKVAFRARYANGVELECMTNKLSFGVKFEGTDGFLQVLSRKMVSNIKDLKPVGPDEQRLYLSTNNYRNFIDCVKSRKEPIQPVETGHRTATVCHLGNIAMILRRKIRWDPKAERIIGDEEATKMLSRSPRAPWSYDMALKA